MKSMMKSVGCGVSLIVAASLACLTMNGCAGDRTHESTGEYVDDSTITTKVKAALVKDPIVKAFEIKVVTFKGVVQLSGFVDHQDQVKQAVADARAVAGVVEVKNNMQLK